MSQMNRYVLLSCTAFSFVLVGMTTGISYAGAVHGIGENVTLADLLDGGEIIAGDKRFSNFIYTPMAGAPTADNVSVIGFFDNVVDGFGLQFSGDFTAGPFNGPILEAGLGFTVDALDPNYVISDVHLSGTVNVFGDGIASIIETIVGVPVPNLNIVDMVVNGQQGPNQTDDWVIFADEIDVIGYSRISVFKDISAKVGDGLFDEASVTTFRQVFTQQEIEIPGVPEPGTMALLGIAIVSGMLFTRRRK